MNHSPTEGAQGSANSKTPLNTTEKFIADMELDAMKSRASAWSMVTSLIPDDPSQKGKSYAQVVCARIESLIEKERQLAQSEERVAKLEGALSRLIGAATVFTIACNCQTASQDDALSDVLESARALLSSSKTN